MEDVREQLSGLLEEYGSLTVRELLTGTSNLVLPTMIQSKIILDMQSFVDLREVAMRVAVPKGSGKQVKVQIVTAPTPDTWTEGQALSAGDPTLAAKTITIAPFGKVTIISDLLADTSAINFVEVIGRAHAIAIQKGILDKIVDGMAGASSPNEVEIGTKGDATEADFDFSHISSAISENLVDGWAPDFLVTAPDKFWTAVTTDYDKKLFYGALADFVVSGKAPTVMGLQVYIDPYFETAINAGSAWDGTDGEKYAIVGTKGISALWAALQDAPVVEIERSARALSNYIVSHIDGGADEGPDASICLIKHAD